MLKIKHLLPNATLVFPLYLGQRALIKNGDRDILTSKVVDVPVCTEEFTVIETENSFYEIGKQPV